MFARALAGLFLGAVAGWLLFLAATLLMWPVTFAVPGRLELFLTCGTVALLGAALAMGSWRDRSALGRQDPPDLTNRDAMR